MSSTTSQVSVDFRPWVALPVEASRRILPAERAKRKCPIDNIRGSTKCRLRARKLGSTLRTARKGDHMKFGSRQTILGATGILMVCLVGVGAIVFFYSGNFFHWSGIKGLYQTFQAWFRTGHKGNGHEKPFYYWLILIARYEWPACVGLLLCAFCQSFRNISLRYLAITGVGIFIAYSIIHYKTPWCIISIIWPLLFIFGSFILILPKRWLTTALATAALILTASLGWAISLNYFRCSTFVDYSWKTEKTIAANIADFFRSEPYVYVQTYNDIYKLTTPLLELARADPKYYHLTGHIIRASPYPLPWILDEFPRIGYYEHDSYPPAMDADFLLVQEDKVAEVESKLHDSYFTEALTIRPYQDTSKVYFRANLPEFKKFFPDRAPDFVGKH